MGLVTLLPTSTRLTSGGVRVRVRWGTGLGGVQDGQPVPQPQENPGTYPGVFRTRDNPYPGLCFEQLGRCGSGR